AMPPPRPIPLEVLDQLDDLLNQAIDAMRAGREPAIETATFWNALSILRHTGIRFAELAHLHAPDQQGQAGCLENRSGRDWGLIVDASKTHRIYKVSFPENHDVVQAIWRQRDSSTDVRSRKKSKYLFCTSRG